MDNNDPIISLELPSRKQLRMQIKPSRDQIVSGTLMQDKIWEAANTHLIQGLLSNGECFVDIGANLAYFSLLAADRIGSQGKVLAFEPEPENHTFCITNLALNGFENIVTLEKLALGQRDEEQTLYCDTTNHGAHQLSQPLAVAFTEKTLSQQVTSLDQYLTRHPHWNPIAGIKIDVQGYETKALLGMQETLLYNKEWLWLLVEFSPSLLKAFDTQDTGLDRFFQFLEEETDTILAVNKAQSHHGQLVLDHTNTSDLQSRIPMMEKLRKTYHIDPCLDLLLTFSPTGTQYLQSKLSHMKAQIHGQASG